MRQQIKALSAQTLIYGLGHIVARSVTFLLLPLYTNVFSTAEYGVISLAYAFMGFMGVMLHYGLDAALMKKYIQASESQRPTYLTTAYVSFVITSIIFSTLIYLLRDGAAQFILGGPYGRFMAYIALILLLDLLWSIPQLLLRSDNRPKIYLAFSMTNVLLSLALNIIFVLKMGMGIEGVLLGNLITSATIFVVTLPVVMKRMTGGKISSTIWRNLMRFGLPFFPAGLFAMIMEIADRYILKALTDVETVGLYSAGYKLGSLMLLVVMGFNMAWHPFFLRQDDSPESRKLFARIATYVMAILGFIWVIMIVWVPHLVRLRIGPGTFYGQEFWGSTDVVPLIALAYLFHGAYLLQLPGTFLLEQSKWVAVTRGIGALVAVVLNFALIPHYGAMGAAWATMLSFLIMALAFGIINRSLFPIPYEWGRLARIAVLLGLIWMIFRALPPSRVNDVALTLFYPAGLLLTRFLSAGEWRALRRITRGAD